MTAVEFALIAPVLMFFIMGICEMGLMAGAQNILDGAAFAASRAGKTGYVATSKTQQQMITAAVTKIVGSYLNPSKIVVTSLSYSDFSNVGQPEPYTDTNKNGKRDAGESFIDVNGNGAWDSDQGKSGYGAAGEIVLYTLTYNWSLFTPMMSKLVGSGGIVPLKARVVVRNEPYG
ncbi:TadE family protein [Hansschlegelia quercus]|uniref:TadE family protein n=1 Tax=Hansschlegelia quercus TaxID=2528245 RepID=UPI001FE047BE|nr:TadE/TadG family type IV pilus assembly protein [Hansschlegelia quercus]